MLRKTIRIKISDYLLSNHQKLAAYIYFAFRKINLTFNKYFDSRFNSKNLRQTVPKNTFVELNNALLIIVEDIWLAQENWRPGCGNYMFEIYETAISSDLFEDVHLFSFSSKSSVREELEKLSKILSKKKYGYCLASIEADPYPSSGWNWDYFAVLISESWNGTFLALSTDAVYDLHKLRFARFTHLFPKTKIIGIDVQCDDKFIRHENFFGPTFLPISKSSVEIISKNLENLLPIQPKFDLVFVGKVYPYRQNLLNTLSSSGITIGVNPHLQAIGQETSLNSSYVNYIGALRMGKLAINFSRANGKNQPQLKSRVLESSLFGVPVITDESYLISKFYKEGNDFVFQSFEEKNFHYPNILRDNKALKIMKESAKNKSMEIHCTAFWEEIRSAISTVNK